MDARLIFVILLSSWNSVTLQVDNSLFHSLFLYNVARGGRCLVVVARDSPGEVEHDSLQRAVVHRGQLPQQVLVPLHLGTVVTDICSKSKRTNSQAMTIGPFSHMDKDRTEQNQVKMPPGSKDFERTKRTKVWNERTTSPAPPRSRTRLNFSQTFRTRVPQLVERSRETRLTARVGPLGVEEGREQRLLERPEEALQRRRDVVHLVVVETQVHVPRVCSESRVIAVSAWFVVYR